MEIPAGLGLWGGQLSPRVYKDLTSVLRFCLQPVRRVPVLICPCEIPSESWLQGYPNFSSPSFVQPSFGRKSSRRQDTELPTRPLDHLENEPAAVMWRGLWVTGNGQGGEGGGGV